MKATKFLPPYFKDKGEFKCSLKFTETDRAGVYMIKSERSGKVVYIGMSKSSLYKALYRHFQQWNDRTQYRATFSKTGYTIRIILCTPTQAEKLERALIAKHKPESNAQQFERESILEKILNEKIDFIKTSEITTEEAPF